MDESADQPTDRSGSRVLCAPMAFAAKLVILFVPALAINLMKLGDGSSPEIILLVLYFLVLLHRSFLKRISVSHEHDYRTPYAKIKPTENRLGLFEMA